MELLLMADVSGLGKEGDIVNVADGYARNYLLPRKLAAPATLAMKRKLARVQQEREQKKKEEMETAKRRAAELSSVSCTIPVKVGDDQKMFGSVTAARIVEALKAQGVDVDRHALVLESPIKELGIYDVRIKLHPEVHATIKVWVVEE